jgi:hypothetical protein
MIKAKIVVILLELHLCLNSHIYTHMGLKLYIHTSTYTNICLNNCLYILSHIPGMCGSVTNNSTTRIRIGYRIYSLRRFIAAADYLSHHWV